jgi:hypothetical protein
VLGEVVELVVSGVVDDGVVELLLEVLLGAVVDCV